MTANSSMPRLFLCVSLCAANGYTTTTSEHLRYSLVFSPLPRFLLLLLLSSRPEPDGHQVLYSDSFRKQVQGKAAFVLDTPEMRRVRETQRIISGVRLWL